MPIVMIKIVPRLVISTNEIELFYRDEKKDIICVSEREGHCNATYGYYLTKTKKIPKSRTEEAKHIVDDYINEDSRFKQSIKLS